MGKDKKPLGTVGIFLIALGIFGLSSLVLKWPLVVGGILSVGTYISLNLIFPDVKKIGSTPVDELSSGETLKEELDQAKRKIASLGLISKDIGDPEIRTMGQDLYNIGRQILDYLEKNPKSISKSLYFLSYDVDMALRIIDNYKTLAANISKDKLLEVEANTEKSLRILVQKFAGQRDSFYQGRIEDLKLDTEILSKTLELQEMEKQKEDIQTQTDKDFVKSFMDKYEENNRRDDNG